MKQHPIFIGKRFKLKENTMKDWGTTHKRIQEEIALIEAKELIEA